MKSHTIRLSLAAIFLGLAACAAESPDTGDGSDSAVATRSEETAAASPASIAQLAPDQVQRTELWLALQGANAVAAVDAATGEELRRIGVGEVPTYVKVSPDGRWVAVANSGSSTASIIDAESDSVVRTVETGRTPKGLNWSPDSRQLWVVNEGAEPGSVWVYAAPGFERVATITVGKAPHNVVLSADGARAYVTNTGSRSVNVVDARGYTVQDTIPLDGAAHNLTLAPSGDRLYVTLTDRSAIAVVDVGRGEVVDTIPVVKGHHVPALDGLGHLVVGGFDAGAASVVQLGEAGAVRSDSIALDHGAHGVTFGPGDRAYVTTLIGDHVAEIDPRTARVVRKIPTRGRPFTVSIRVLTPDGRTIGARPGAAS